MKFEVQIIGLGYVGLPLAICSTLQYKTNCVDASTDRIRIINDKSVCIEDSTVKADFLRTNISASNKIEKASIHVICVPTPVDEFKKPDLTLLVGAIESLIPVLDDDDLIIVESTIYPGLCEEILVPVINKTLKKIHLAHCPERINPGDKKYGVKNIDRVLGATTDVGLERAYDFYKCIINAKIKKLKSIKSAEATKVMENIFRDVNIALVNEMAQAFYRMQIDVVEVIDAASTKPFSFMPHQPGVGVGGHCIAVDPYYMIERGNAAGFDHEFLRLARKINENMPTYTVNLLHNLLNKMGLTLSKVRVGVYGLSYKQDVEDDRESPSYVVIKKLVNDKNANVEIYDPYHIDKSTKSSINKFLENIDCLIVCTSHSEIKEINWNNFINIKLILDGRNCLSKEAVEAAGVKYAGIGV